ncbi:hypothetical protein CASFOL_031584 [Castilleja foliolosa]|uniref:F-box domain-containing protein n=1 Tax=Castilleja foliolosa TaxID=1961234 RepID=A0ABD3C6E7_9LAMI
MADYMRKTEWMLEEILVRVPGEDLVNSKLVCKDWHDLINSPNFVSAYYNHHILSQGMNKRKSNWDDEDLDDNDMKDSSEEEEEDEPAPAWYTAELFGKMGDEKTLDDFIPKSESDFTEYAEFVVHKLRPYEDEPVPSLLKKDYNLNSNWNVEDLDDYDVKDSWEHKPNSNWDVGDLDDNDLKDSWEEEEDESAGKKREDEPVPSLLKKDYNLNSNWDVEDLDDNDVKDSWEHKRNSNWDVEDLDDNDVKDSWEEEDESAGKKREDEPVPSLLKKDYKLKSNWDDEDLDDNDVKDSSEEDEEEEDEPAPWGCTADTNGVLFDGPRAAYETELKDFVKKLST